MVIVADGMGGHAAGNVASNMAVQTFNRHLSKNFPNENISNVLYEAVLQANGSITATVSETAALKGMGCTLVACVLERGQLRWVSVGDSHLYLLRNGDLSKKNADHSYGGFLDRMAEAGTPVEAEAGFSRNMLMSALTGDDIAEIDCPESPLPLKRGDRVILSSDGLDTLDKQQIIDICAAQATPKACVDALLQAVNDAGAPRQDNTTVIVIDVIEKAEAPLEIAAAPAPRLEEISPQPAPARVSARSLPTVEDDEPRRGTMGMVVGIVLALLALGGGGYWYWMQNQGKTPVATVDKPELDIEAEAEPGGRNGHRRAGRSDHRKQAAIGKCRRRAGAGRHGNGAAVQTRPVPRRTARWRPGPAHDLGAGRHVHHGQSAGADRGRAPRAQRRGQAVRHRRA
ncbi:MAG: serine/threonine-protein phosphatase [Proteobacteria bacterium]|nr:serine/threonine-protein phosphatase [Pseudomonadota bacterium]